jgi:hypothetical protein
MSDLVAAVAAKLAGAPEELVVRSAQARARAQGVTVDEVLAAWAGEGALEAAPAAAEAPAPAPEEAPAPAAEPVPEPAAVAPEPVAAPTPEPAAVPSAVAVAAAPVEEPEIVEPGDLMDRIKVSARMGAVLGGVFGLLAVAISAPVVLNRLATVGDPAGPAVEVTRLAGVLTAGVASAVFGAVIALLVRAGGAFRSAGFALRGRALATGIGGAMVGFVLGVIGMGILGALNEEGLDGTVLLSARSTIVAIVLGGIVFGAITAAAAQAIGQPRALADQEEASETVRRRISNAVFIPVLVALVIVLFVVPLGVVLVEYASFAPLIAILVSALILTFSSLMASRPNLRVTRGEVLTAIAGVGVVVLLLALIAAQLGGGGHGEEDDHGEAEALVVSTF